ncbi:protoporphyrinogen oxidase [Candidatus Leptofilum sp.]|uniref:protoporphyrinogen oxidase n=1 Tax=Candidatus Leptofilum sp. TaxID=3241576 RepID=UPI003B5BF210
MTAHGIQRIVVAGGGISGLVTAYYLEKEARQQGITIHTTVLEKVNVLGGKIATQQQEGFVFEGGPESFVTRKPEAWELCHELGLQDQLVGTTSSGKNYVLHNGRPAIVPSGPGSFLSTPLLSAKGKLRLLKEPFVKPRTETSDESLGSFLRRRVGDEMVDNIVKPAIGSVYLGNVDEMSVQVSFGRFAEMEQTHGSVVRGMFGLMKEKRADRKASGEPRPAKKPGFATLKTGLMGLIETLADRIEGEILLDTAVTHLHHDLTHTHPFTLSLSNGRALRADLVVLAIPTFVIADLLDGLVETAVINDLRNIPYNPVTTVNLAFNRNKINNPFDGFGVVVPDTESSSLLAVEGMSVKFPHRAPNDQFVLRAFVGGQKHPALASLSEHELIALVRQELEQIFDITANPTQIHVQRWLPANPQPPVGHLAMIAQVEQKLAEQLPQLYLTGAGLRGQGIPDCIRQSRNLVKQIMANIAEYNPLQRNF